MDMNPYEKNFYDNTKTAFKEAVEQNPFPKREIELIEGRIGSIINVPKAQRQAPRIFDPNFVQPPDESTSIAIFMLKEHNFEFEADLTETLGNKRSVFNTIRTAVLAVQEARQQQALKALAETEGSSCVVEGRFELPMEKLARFLPDGAQVLQEDGIHLVIRPPTDRCGCIVKITSGAVFGMAAFPADPTKEIHQDAVGAK